MDSPRRTRDTGLRVAHDSFGNTARTFSWRCLFHLAHSLLHCRALVTFV